MKLEALLLPKYGVHPERLHDGKIITLASDLRWCSDSFEIRCWNGERVHVAFSLDCCESRGNCLGRSQPAPRRL
jgi:putative transposase